LTTVNDRLETQNLSWIKGRMVHRFLAFSPQGYVR